MLSESILLIDDHPRIGQLFKLLLERSRYAHMRLLYAADLATGIIALQRSAPSLVFLDNFLGEYDGFSEPLKFLRGVSDVPVILFTGADLDELGYKQTPKGLAGYMSKSGIDVKRLETTISDVLNKPKSSHSVKRTQHTKPQNHIEASSLS